MPRRRIAVVTGTRAEFGLLSEIMALLRADRRCDLQVVVTGQHLLRELGHTVDEITRAGHTIAARVPARLADDSAAAVATAVGALTSGFARAFVALRPELIVVLGDRYEVLAAASAALPLKVPVAHLHGGESTTGAIDDQIRHAVTKLSHVHFPATRQAARRLVRMGEEPSRVFCFGAPGVDNLKRVAFLSRADLMRSLGLERTTPLPHLGAVTFHPVTLGTGSAGREIAELIAALDSVRGVRWVCTLPGADPGYRAIIKALEAFAARRPDRVSLHASLGQVRYLSLLREADVVVGNSSSGIIEAPSLKARTINIGDRQLGRERAASVIDVPRCERGPIATAIRGALAKGPVRTRNPYEGKDTCARVAEALCTLPLGEAMLRKPFFAGAAIGLQLS